MVSYKLAASDFDCVLKGYLMWVDLLNSDKLKFNVL